MYSSAGRLSGPAKAGQPVAAGFLARWHLSPQYFTSAQQFLHFLRYSNGLPQVAHIFVGSKPFLSLAGGMAGAEVFEVARTRTGARLFLQRPAGRKVSGRPPTRRAFIISLMIKFLMLLLAAVAGAVLPVQAVLNARLGQVAGNGLVGAFVSFVVGSLALGLVVVGQGGAGRHLAALRAAPPSYFVGGLLGAVYVAAVVALTPRLGAALTVALVVVGQLAVAVVLDHFGALGLPVHVLTLPRLLGLGLLLAGLWLIRSY